MTGNTASYGGGVYVTGIYGNVLIDHVTFTGNVATVGGGGFYIRHKDPASEVTVSNSTFTDNVAQSGRGGGIVITETGTNISILSSTISGNTASGNGAGIAFQGSGSIINSTIANNSSGATVDGGFVPLGNGGGLYLARGSITVANSTIAGNSALSGGGVFNDAPATVLTDTIVAGNSPDDLAMLGQREFNASFSLIQNPGGAIFVGEVDAGLPDAGVPDGGVIPGPGNIGWVDPQLGALANNGGPTQTMLPAQASPVVNTGDPNFAMDLAQDLLADYVAPDGGSLDASVPPIPSTDQRGLPRVGGSRIDMGAVELPPPYVDAGPIVMDGGSEGSTDAGNVDGGSMGATDAGTMGSPDAGQPVSDAGEPVFTDAGPAGSSDAGTMSAADGGSSSSSKGGCGCGSTSDGALALVSPVGALLLRRRRKTSRVA